MISLFKTFCIESKKGSGWAIESVDKEYGNISIFSRLSGSTDIKLPRRLRTSMIGLINIKNNDNKFFLWCHIRHFNSLKIHPEKLTKTDKSMINNLHCEGIEFSVSKEDLTRLK